MNFCHLLKGILILGGLVFMAGTASAQYDLDVKNGTSCDFDVMYKHDDGSGGCPVSYAGGSAPANTYTTIPSGQSSGSPFHVGIVDANGGVAVSVGDCSLTTCGCAGLPATTTINACGTTYTVDFYPPGTAAVNAVVVIY